MTGAAATIVRPARREDAGVIASIFNQGIAERVATFRTRPRSEGAIADLIGADAPLLVAEAEGTVVGFAKAEPYEEANDYYDGINEVTVYVERSARRAGVGRALIEGLALEAERRGLHKLTAKILSTNAASIILFRRCGFREVGTHRRHATLGGEWRDVILVERLIGPAASDL